MMARLSLAEIKGDSSNRIQSGLLKPNAGMTALGFWWMPMPMLKSELSESHLRIRTIKLHSHKFIQISAPMPLGHPTRDFHARLFWSRSPKQENNQQTTSSRLGRSAMCFG